MARIFTISYTGRDASGGVPRWNRDFESAFPDHEVGHFSWDTFVNYNKSAASLEIPEWDKAVVLNSWLKVNKVITKDDIIVADGFWLAGLEPHEFPKTVSVAHGIWSHLTHEEAAAGKKPDMPFHHNAQVKFRKRYKNIGGRIVAVSDFIADQMRLQFGIESEVINNAVDYEEYSPKLKKVNSWPEWAPEKLIVHGVNDKTNANKGWDHIQHLKENLKQHAILSLDEAHERYKFSSKAQTLANADLVVIPSGYEGNSYFCLEALACDRPIVAYSVGLPYRLKSEFPAPGIILERQQRSPQYFLEGVKQALDLLGRWSGLGPRMSTKRFCDISVFRKSWRDYFGERQWL